MARQMDYAPPPSIPPIERPYREDGGLTRSPYMSSDQIVSQMPDFLRQFFQNTKIERPPSLQPTLDRLKIPTPAGQMPGGLFYDNRVAIPRSNEAGVIPAAQHELLHALAWRHPKFYADTHMTNYEMLRGVLQREPSQDPEIQRSATAGDWQHVFTQLAAKAMSSPNELGPETQNYFAPLLPPVQRQSGPR